jgi:hypothetical protein
MKRKSDEQLVNKGVKRFNGKDHGETIKWSGDVSAAMSGFFKKKSFWLSSREYETREALMKIGCTISTDDIIRKRDVFDTFPRGHLKMKQDEWESKWFDKCFVCRKSFRGDNDRTKYYERIVQLNGPAPETAREFKWVAPRPYLLEQNSHPHYYALLLVAEPRKPVCWACHRIIF